MKKILSIAFCLAMVMVLATSTFAMMPGGGLPSGDSHRLHDTVDVPGKAATCTEKGLTDGKFCNTCGKFVVSQKDIPVTGHNFESGICTVCGAGEHDDHNVADVAGKAATCTEKGLTDGKFCMTCGKFVVSQKDIPAGHNFVDGTCTVCGAGEHDGHDLATAPAKEPTCNEKGLTEGTFCNTCGKFVVSQKDIPATGNHSIEDGNCTVCGTHDESHDVNVVPGKKPTCTEKGLTDGTFCNTCGKFLVSQKDIPETGHDFVDGICTVCGAGEHDGHDVVDVPGKAATCTEPGLTDGKYCETCEKVVVEQERIIHEVVDVPGKAATCTEKGLTDGTFCKTCGKFVVSQQDIPETGHSFEDGACTVCGEADPDAGEPDAGEPDVGEHAGHEVVDVPGKAATCTEKGLSDGTFCTDCGMFVVNQKTIPAKGHNFENHVCTECGESHNIVEAPSKEPTCTERGLTEGTFCMDCMIFVESQKDIPATGHNFVDGDCTVCGVSEHEGHELATAPSREPTCTERGLTEGTFCMDCMIFVESQKDIPATGHNFENHVCTECGESHNIVEVPGKEATCTEKGLTDGTFCMDCGKFVVNQKDIPAKDHNYADGTCTMCGEADQTCEHEYEVVRELKATCQETGYVWEKCTKCGDERNYETAALGDHNYEVGKCTMCGEADPDCKHENTRVEIFEANCSKEGTSTVICNDCGAEVSTETLPTNDNHAFHDGICLLCGAEEVLPCEHEYEVVRELKATCQEAGYVWEKCTKCGWEHNYETAALGDHNYETGKCTVCGEADPDCKHEHTHLDVFEANCSKEGTSSVVCSDCGVVISTEVLPVNENHAFHNGTCLLCGASEPTEPEVEPTEPEVEPTEPEVEPTEPEVEPTEPEVEPTKPVIKPTKPVIKPIEPEAGSNSESVPFAGDDSFLVIAVAVLSMTGLIVIVSKKRVF